MKRNLVDSRWTHYLDVNYWNDGSPLNGSKSIKKIEEIRY